MVQNKAEDHLSKWVQNYLVLESEHYAYDKIESAENTLDSIVINAWRKPISTAENDQFFKVHWYKAFYLKDKGEIVQAKNHFEKSLNYYSKSTKIFPGDLLIIYPPLGNIYTILGENEKAIIAHQKMIEVSNSLNSYEGKDDDLAVAYTNLSIVYETQKNLALAIETVEKVKMIPSVSDYNLGIALSNYGKYLFQQNKLNAAGVELKNAIELLEKIDNIDKYFLGGIYKTMALISIEKNNIEVANYFLDLAIENYKKSELVRNREIAKSYAEKSKISSNEIELLNIALQYLIPHKNDFPKEFMPIKDELFAENTLADIFYKETKLPLEPSLILQCYENYFEVQKLIRKEYLFKNSKKVNLQKDRKVIDEAINFCYYMYSKNKDEKYAIKALSFIEKEKSILLYESLVNKLEDDKSEAYLLYLSDKKSLINELIAAQLIGAADNVKSIKETIKKLDFDNDINAEKVSRNTKFLDEFDLVKFQQNFLKDEEALIVFYDDIDLFSIVVTDNHVKMNKIIKDSQFVTNLYKYASSFSFENRFSFDKKNAQYLGKSIGETIPNETKKIYLATDGILNNIPFESLMQVDNYFIEKYEFQYIFSANILQNIEYKKVNNNKLLAIAPVFKDDPKKHLIKSEEEVDNVLKLIKGSSLLAEEAKTSNFIHKAKEFAIIHISSHAQIDKKLQVASIDFFDKSLYFSQIEQEQFETELLVLSACETGIGKQEAGEGSLSLTKAFAYSKIPSIISSLWKVNEGSSLTIFNTFYQNIKAKKSISNSLRIAKLDYLYNDEIAEEKKQPYYWASFILLGEDSVLGLETVSNNLIYFYLILAIILLILFWIFNKYLKNNP